VTTGAGRARNSDVGARVDSDTVILDFVLVFKINMKRDGTD
jgi:hypothetical protein